MLYNAILGGRDNVRVTVRIKRQKNISFADNKADSGLENTEMPNVSSKTRVKAIRIKNETADYIDGDKKNALNHVVESLYDAVQSGKVRLSNSEVVIPKKNRDLEGVNTKKGYMTFEIPEDIGQDLKNMLEIFDVTMEEAISELQRALDEGELDIQNGKFVVENAQ